MKPKKGLIIFAAWTMRMAFLLGSYFLFFDTVKVAAFESFEFWFAALFSLFSILIFAGGFLRKHDLTVISGFILCILIIVRIVKDWGGLDEALVIWLFMLSGSLYFFGAGNKN